MKKLLIILSLVSTFSLQAAEIKAASFDGDKILIDVTYSGGCEEHKFDLQLMKCNKISPLHCKAKLIHKTQDQCEAFIYDRLEFSINRSDLLNINIEGTSLSIFGDNNSEATITF